MFVNSASKLSPIHADLLTILPQRPPKVYWPTDSDIMLGMQCCEGIFRNSQKPCALEARSSKGDSHWGSAWNGNCWMNGQNNSPQRAFEDGEQAMWRLWEIKDRVNVNMRTRTQRVLLKWYLHVCRCRQQWHLKIFRNKCNFLQGLMSEWFPCYRGCSTDRADEGFLWIMNMNNIFLLGVVFVGGLLEIT